MSVQNWKKLLEEGAQLWELPYTEEAYEEDNDTDEEDEDEEGGHFSDGEESKEGDERGSKKPGQKSLG